MNNILGSKFPRGNLFSGKYPNGTVWSGYFQGLKCLELEFREYMFGVEIFIYSEK